MHLIETIDTDLEEAAMKRPPFGPGFLVVPPGADRMEVWGTSYNDPGPDYCEFRLMANDRILATRHMDGF